MHKSVIMYLDSQCLCVPLAVCGLLFAVRAQCAGENEGMECMRFLLVFVPLKSCGLYPIHSHFSLVCRTVCTAVGIIFRFLRRRMALLAGGRMDGCRMNESRQKWQGGRQESSVKSCVKSSVIPLFNLQNC